MSLQLKMHENMLLLNILENILKYIKMPIINDIKYYSMIYFYLVVLLFANGFIN